MTQTTILVDGMTCEHCMHAVTEEVSALPTVSEVTVALVAGGTSTVSVTSLEPLSADSLREAIDEAGYTLVSTS